jgi:hypothetical protein
MINLQYIGVRRLAGGRVFEIFSCCPQQIIIPQVGSACPVEKYLTS